MARISLRLLREVSGFAKMVLLSWSYKTMRYFLPREEVTGKHPVWSVFNFPVNSTVFRYAIWVRTLGSYEGRRGVVITGGLEMGVEGEVVMVDRTFYGLGVGDLLRRQGFWASVCGQDRKLTLAMW